MEEFFKHRTRYNHNSANSPLTNRNKPFVFRTMGSAHQQQKRTSYSRDSRHHQTVLHCRCLSSCESCRRSKASRRRRTTPGSFSKRRSTKASPSTSTTRSSSSSCSTCALRSIAFRERPLPSTRQAWLPVALREFCSPEMLASKEQSGEKLNWRLQVYFEVFRRPKFLKKFENIRLI